MFNKKNCSKCGKKISKEYDFCPYCGTPLDDNNNWGMLGKNDSAFESNENNPLQNPFFNNSMINKMLGSAMKMLEKEMKKTMKEEKPRTKLQLYINGKKVNLNSKNKPIEKPKQTKRKTPSTTLTFSKENQSKFAKLSKKEPETNVRRLSDRVIFEIKMPDVKSTKDISIRSLENSIEIKAIAKEKAYYKIIQVGLPVINYNLDKGKLTLELEAKH